VCAPGDERCAQGYAAGSQHGVEPPAIDAVPLPPLARDTVSRGFFITIEGVVDYATASHAMTSALHGRVVAEGGRTVIVDSVVVSAASGGRLALAVNFTGDARGTLRFLGTPHYDAGLGEVTIPDLDYDLTTDNDLVNAFAWLKSDELREMFRQKARLPIEPIRDQGKELVLKGHNRSIKDQVTLTGTVDSVAVLALFVRQRGLLVRASADGDARVGVKPKAKPVVSAKR